MSQEKGARIQSIGASIRAGFTSAAMVDTHAVFHGNYYTNRVQNIMILYPDDLFHQFTFPFWEFFVWCIRFVSLCVKVIQI